MAAAAVTPHLAVYARSNNIETFFRRATFHDRNDIFAVQVDFHLGPGAKRNNASQADTII
jgi:hypothetical protein